MRKLLPVAFVCLAVAPLACQMAGQNWATYSPEYLRVLAAAEKVLGRHFVVTGVDKPHGIVGASSVVRANIFTKYRTRAEARVLPAGVGRYGVQVRVTNELEISEPSLLGRGQPGYDWRAVGFDHVLEAALMTEVQAELQGQTVAAVPPSATQFLKPPVPAKRHRDLFGPGNAPAKPAAKPESKAPIPPAAQAPPKADPSALHAQYLALGDVYEKRNDHKKALLEYQRAAMTRQDDATAHLSLATVFTALSRYDAAAGALREAAGASKHEALDAQDVRRLRSLAQDINERLLALTGWCKQNPKDGDAQLVLGYHGLLADRADEARETLAALLKASPNDPAAQFLMRNLPQS